MRLFNRSTRSLALMDAGRALLNRIAPALVELYPQRCRPFPGFFLCHAIRRPMRPGVRATIDFFVAANQLD